LSICLIFGAHQKKSSVLILQRYIVARKTNTQNKDQFCLFPEDKKGELPKRDVQYMKILTKEDLITELRKIRELGWIPNARLGNVGGVGNTLEDLLGIEENNLPIPNAAEWELKCHREGTTSLVTLCHMEPSPRALGFVPRILLPYYGWSHQGAGTTYGVNEKSFRQTISGANRSDRGFMVIVDRKSQKVLISFDANAVDPRHKEWLNEVNRQIGSAEINPQPYWGFTDLEHRVGTKLLNCFFIQAKVKIEDRKEYYWYSDILMLQGFSIDKLLIGIDQGYVYVDFDARTGHNHGTKFRLTENMLPNLYEKVVSIK